MEKDIQQAKEKEGSAQSTSFQPTRFEQLLEKFEPEKPRRGQLLKGKVLQVLDDAILLDVGAKRDAVVPRKELSKIDEHKLEDLKRGDQLPVFVMRTPVGSQRLLVSIERGRALEDWDRAEEYLSSGEALKLKVIDQNNGGLVVRFGSLRGFVPNSHIPGLRRNASYEVKADYKKSKIGTEIQVTVIDVNQRQRRLVVSARAAEQALRQQRLRELEVGQVIEGEVVSIVDFGVFVDLGGVDGLVHISELDNRHMEHPSEVVKLGEVLEVKVLRVEIDSERVGLSRKALLPSPWDTVEERYEVGDLVEGVVTNVRDFGAFVMLPDGIEGLIHKSEIGIVGQGQSEDVVESGEHVITRVIHIEPQRERMSLSLRQVTYNEEVAWRQKKQGTGDDNAETGVLKDLSDLGAAYQMQYGDQAGNIKT
jgi:small subunit ribosomal protein S1